MNPTLETAPIALETAPTAPLEPIQGLWGHTSPETAFIIPDYPYGRTLRCQKRVWIEQAPKGAQKGKFRVCYQTTNPKREGEVWNKTHAGTYHDFCAMYLDEEGLLKTWACDIHWPESAAKFSTLFRESMPEDIRVKFDELMVVSEHLNQISWEIYGRKVEELGHCEAKEVTEIAKDGESSLTVWNNANIFGLETALENSEPVEAEAPMLTIWDVDKPAPGQQLLICAPPAPVVVESEPELTLDDLEDEEDDVTVWSPAALAPIEELRLTRPQDDEDEDKLDFPEDEDLEDEDDLGVIFYTDAPEVYDSYGTKTLEYIGSSTRGETVRKVSVTSGFQRQKSEYTCSGHFCLSESDWPSYTHLLEHGDPVVEKLTEKLETAPVVAVAPQEIAEAFGLQDTPHVLVTETAPEPPITEPAPVETESPAPVAPSYDGPDIDALRAAHKAAMDKLETVPLSQIWEVEQELHSLWNQIKQAESALQAAKAAIKAKYSLGARSSGGTRKPRAPRAARGIMNLPAGAYSLAPIKRGSKLHSLMVVLAQGATVEEMIAATGWKQVHGYLNSEIHVRGYGIRQEGDRFYLVFPEGHDQILIR